MNKKLIIGATLAAIFISLYIMFMGKTEIKNMPLKEGSVVAFGDSLVAGVGASKERDLVSLLSQKIVEPIINLGVSGETTTGGLARISEVLDVNPRVVIVLLGGNDFLRKVPRATTFSNLEEIVAKIQDSGSAVMLLGVRGGLLSDNADSLYEDLARKTGAAYVPDVLDGLFADSRYMSDSIHPNDAGYAKIADRVYPVLKDLLGE